MSTHSHVFCKVLLVVGVMDVCGEDSASKLFTYTSSLDSVSEDLLHYGYDYCGNDNGLNRGTAGAQPWEHDQFPPPFLGWHNIPMCKGFSREQWVGLDVILINDAGVSIANGIRRNLFPTECVDANPLGDNDVGVCITNSLMPLEVPQTRRFSLRWWPCWQVLHNGVSLWNHARRHNPLQVETWSSMEGWQGVRRYDSTRQS